MQFSENTGHPAYDDPPLKAFVRRSRWPAHRASGSPWLPMHYSTEDVPILDATADQLLTPFTSWQARLRLGNLCVAHLLIGGRQPQTVSDAIGNETPVIATPVDPDDLPIYAAPRVELRMSGWMAYATSMPPMSTTFSPPFDTRQHHETGQLQMRFIDPRI